mmetsp:Transcript_99921/g.287153  ORF Transcript_99921/g.287153 Transcript_99921/m.287153 type:complete len:357 (-) Transcript_99921:117-1187(-)
MFADSGRNEQEVVEQSAVIAKKYSLTGETIYRGLASTIFHAMDRSCFLQVAIKVLMKRGFDNEDEYRNALYEVELHSAIPPHGNIIRLLASEETPDAILLATPFTPHGDLWNLTRYGQTYCEPEVRHCAAQMMTALRHLHMVCGVVHCDIKPHNFLLFRTQTRYCVQLIDFGLAQQTDENGVVAFHGVRGTSGWYSPEMLAHRDYSYPIDVWGCGLIVFRMLGGYHPFDPPSNFRQPAEFDDRCWCHVGPVCRQLISKLLDRDPAARITATQACEDIWMTGPAQPPPTAEQLEALSAYGPPPSTDVRFWPAGQVPEPHMCNSYINLSAMSAGKVNLEEMDIDNDDSILDADLSDGP